MKANHIMLDLETLGTHPDAVIFSIGAVRFDHDGWYDPFQISINLQSCVDAGLEFDASTILWWMTQSDEARRQFAKPTVALAAGLQMFGEWIRRPETVWGNGADFDNVILSSAYRQCGLSLPWKWNRNRCYRTLKNLCDSVSFNRLGVHHDALADAKDQALHLVACLKEIGRLDLLEPDEE